VSIRPGLDGSWNHEPTVVWLSAYELEVSVDRISQIVYQRQKARGIKVTYRIGKVDYP
jgi:hypothetical protein